MPALRASTRRRRSSIANLAAPSAVKPGRYGVISPRNVTFAPNVTPISYVENDDSLRSETASPSTQLFPPSEEPTPPSKKRLPPGKRRSQGYIPRPPNAFMLFRADFVRQKHVPGTIETNHGSLSKIIGMSRHLSLKHDSKFLIMIVSRRTGTCWRQLPLEEKRVWEIKAKHAKTEHKKMYPEYRFRPVHNKVKERKAKMLLPADEEQRCEDVAQLLLEGMKGDELAEAVKRLDRMRSTTPASLPRRSSSVPLPGTSFPMTFPELAIPPYWAAGHSRPQSPQMPFLSLPRRPSSAGPAVQRSWTEPFNYVRHDQMLPDVNFGLFEKAYLNDPFPTNADGSFDFNSMFSSLPPNASPSHELHISPLDNVALMDPSFAPDGFAHDSTPTSYSGSLTANEPLGWPGPLSDVGSGNGGHSDPSSLYSGSPAPSELSLPLHAPQPQRAFNAWSDLPTDAVKDSSNVFVHGADGMNFNSADLSDPDLAMQAYAQGLKDMGITPYDGYDYIDVPVGMPEMGIVDNASSHYDLIGSNANTGLMDPYGSDIFSSEYTTGDMTCTQSIDPGMAGGCGTSLQGVDHTMTVNPEASSQGVDLGFNFNDLVHEY
ncbi:hypothetical protein EWM64_g2678 [Hericium alpestre]|uniref:HMG box domain-containing protein n=1 Tax=Hericium alpestre TaxID=135208 RepID=A0A4Z0A4Z8_9AGAM|nr:hypothetical protein EWM64_g2678 [Hericium alpestre]